MICPNCNSKTHDTAHGHKCPVCDWGRWIKPITSHATIDASVILNETEIKFRVLVNQNVFPNYGLIATTIPLN